MSVDEVLADIERFACGSVEVTGGEPLLQKEAAALMEELLARRKTVLVETGGHISLDRVPPGVIRIMDIKCPGSGEAHRMDWTNLDRLQPRDEVKFVMADRADYEYAREALAPVRARRSRHRRALLAGARRAATRVRWPNGCWRMPAGARAAAGAQVHLGAGDAGGVICCPLSAVRCPLSADRYR